MHLVRGPQSTHAHVKLDRVSVTQSMFSDRDSQREVAKQIELSHPPSLKKKKKKKKIIYTGIYNNNNNSKKRQNKEREGEQRTITDKGGISPLRTYNSLV